MPSLRILKVYNMNQCPASVLASLSQLQELTFHQADIQQVSTLAQLTGLTQLEMGFYEDHTSEWPSKAQQELAEVLNALSSLQRLSIVQVPPGPIHEALAQMTTVTKLTCREMLPEQGHLLLPSVRSLTVSHIATTRQLLCIDAPQLQEFQDADELWLQWGPGTAEDLRRLCRGVLRACDSLVLNFNAPRSRQHAAATRAEAVEWTSVLSQEWPATTYTQANRAGLWSLTINGASCTSQFLSLLPSNITELTLR
jgi:hypothetical protein